MYSYFFILVFTGRSWGKSSVRKYQISWASNVRRKQYTCNKGCIFQILTYIFASYILYQFQICKMQYNRNVILLFYNLNSEMNLFGLCVLSSSANTNDVSSSQMLFCHQPLLCKLLPFQYNC